MYQWIGTYHTDILQTQDWVYLTSSPLIIKVHVPVMIHDIVIIIWEDYVYDQ